MEIMDDIYQLMWTVKHPYLALDNINKKKRVNKYLIQP